MLEIKSNTVFYNNKPVFMSAYGNNKIRTIMYKDIYKALDECDNEDIREVIQEVIEKCSNQYMYEIGLNEPLLEKEIVEIVNQGISEGNEITVNIKGFLDKKAVILEFFKSSERGMFKKYSELLGKLAEKYGMTLLVHFYDKWTEENVLKEIYFRTGYREVPFKYFGFIGMTHIYKL